MPSFDVVSKIDWVEFKNAFDQAQREIAQRFDFKGTQTSIEKNEATVVILSETNDRAQAAYTVLEEKLVRRKVSLKHFKKSDPARGPKGTTRVEVQIQEGIEIEKARAILKLIKDHKLKVQAAIHENSVRVSGKKKDDLQLAIQLLRGADSLELDLQFDNFRD